jgi:hypothetical protein
MIEKQQQDADSDRSRPALESQSPAESNRTDVGVFGRVNKRISSLKYLEARGIERVLESERHTVAAADFMQISLLWFSTNITANNIAVGMLGPLAYGLGFTDAALCAAFGAVLGAAGAAYMSTFGPISGNRTMVYTDLNRQHF